MLYAHWRISAHPGRGRPGGRISFFFFFFTTHKNVSQEYFFCLGKNVCEVIGVQYTALCENETNEKNQHPNPAQQG